MDARTAFNDGKRSAILWTVRQKWPSGARFTSNCYKQCALLLIRSNDGESSMCLNSKEGVTRGDLIYMVIYGVEMLPLTTKIQEDIPSRIPLWYADDVEAECGGEFEEMLVYFNRLCEEGPTRVTSLTQPKPS